MTLIFIFIIVICYIARGKCIDNKTVVDNILKFEDLNDDVLLEIFDKLEFGKLADISDVNHRFRNLIASHCLNPKFRFNEQLIKITIPVIDNYYNAKLAFNNDGSIEIFDRELVLKVLRNFGHVISRISFKQFPFPRGWSQRINTYINEYCNESLKELQMDAFDGNLVLSWIKPFTHVNKVHFMKGNWNCEKFNMNFSEIFPSIRHLDLESMRISSSKCIDYHFPNLEHIQFPMHIDAPVKKMYANIFDLNPQIRSIHIRNTDNFDVLHVANEKLNNLETIRLSATQRFSISENEIIRFKNVKQFFITLDQPNFIPLEFNQLEEMKFIWSSFRPLPEKWLQFIEKQKKLQILAIYSRGWSELNLMKIIENLPQLEVLKTSFKLEIADNGIAKVVSSKTKLKKIILNEMTRQKYDMLKDLINPEWQIEGNLKDSKGEVTLIQIADTSDD